MSAGRILDAVIASKGFATKYEVLFTVTNFNVSVPILLLT